MPFMLLIIEPTEQRRGRNEAEGRAVYAQMVDFGSDLQRRGLLLASQSLASQVQATRVQVRDGKAHRLDGPFAEAKEMVGGFFMLDCASYEEAVAIAAECPAAGWCTVEVRSFARCFEDAA